MINQLKITRHYIIFTGFFKYNKSILQTKHLSKMSSFYQPWFTRLNTQNINDFFNYQKAIFYNSFNNICFPEHEFIGNIPEYIKKNKESNKNICLDLFYSDLNKKHEKLLHLTKVHLNPETKYSIKQKSKDIAFNVDYADIYLYPKEEGIFSFKVSVNEPNNLSDISNLLNTLRNLDNSVFIDLKNEVIIKDWINDLFFVETENLDLSILHFDFHDSKKLKTYTVIETDIDMNTKDGIKLENQLLFEMGTVSPIGSSSEQSSNLCPSSEYFEKTINNNKISIFNNWSGLCLLDTFTVLITTPQKERSVFENAEDSYFPMFIHNFYLKAFLFEINTEIISDHSLNTKNRLKRDMFIEVRNNYDFSYISYNFLPNLIFNKHRQSLEIDKEIEFMENKIENLNNYIQERQDKKTNTFLAYITILTLGSAFWDSSEWFQKLFNISQVNYPIISASLVIGSILIILIIWFINRK